MGPPCTLPRNPLRYGDDGFGSPLQAPRISNTDIALHELASIFLGDQTSGALWSNLQDEALLIPPDAAHRASFACIAFTLPAARFFQVHPCLLLADGFSSATHDTAADGLHAGASEHFQAAFVGVRTIFYRFAMIAAQAARHLCRFPGSQWSGYPCSLSITFLLRLLSFWPSSFTIFCSSYPASDRPASRNPSKSVAREFLHIFGLFQEEGYRSHSCFLSPLPACGDPTLKIMFFSA
jgi:PAT family beta-lactamase induction signal transducer AmpG